ncbi:hypothetical protein K6119_16375 [Paracrocinitomix mangrovi]|uniref:hypothetical protein n=1 Tax=Paracrocinitomix mangrovi TaxID=2862509 RepID=UPI001C8E559C|nr:hypothetical protein [Paracrocinitomix mangrovi]UKN01305.1 hypothetical protein K6119_16375 [Paracrocinitomix mangrovi]
MIKDAENIILAKEYFELTAEELEQVSELVQNAEEYEEMKWFLMSTQQTLANEKIQASPELKKSVMDHLNQQKDNRKFWLNGVVVFMFPEDKKLHQKPAFQMAIAALLIVGFLFIYNRPIDDQQMALNDTIEQPIADVPVGDAELKDLEKDVDDLSKEGEISVGEEQVVSGDLATEEPLMVTDELLAPENEDAGVDYFSHPDGVYGQPLESTVDQPVLLRDESNVTSNAQNRETNMGGSIELDSKVETKTTIVGTSDKTVASYDGNKKKDRNQLYKERKKVAQKMEMDELAEEERLVDLDAMEDEKANNPSGNGVTTANNNSANTMNFSVQPSMADDVSGGATAYEIMPTSLSISQNKELNTLFRTFK